MSDSNLTYVEVKRFVGFFPDDTLAMLAMGPLPDDGPTRADTCRVCAALDPLTASGPAGALLEWHDFVSKGFRLLGEIIAGDYGEEIEGALMEEITGLTGACSYARCCTIYGLAAAELNRRRLSECDDAPDERGALERRQDGEAEDAERRLDAEKAGDL